MSRDMYKEVDIVCEVCGEVCTDNFLICEWPGVYMGWCLCPDCHRELYENMIDNPYFESYEQLPGIPAVV